MKKLPSTQALEKIPVKEPPKKPEQLINKKSVLKFPSIEDEKKKKDMNEIKEEAQEEEKEAPKKKVKPEMKDAWTQTERSDYSIMKSRMLNH